MQIVEMKVKELIPYENNPRFNENAIEYVANSIKEFGFKVPIVIDANNVIVCGHTRVKACERLGIKTVPCVIADDLTEEQIKAFRIADNKTAEIAEWDFDMLDMEIAELKDFDLERFGFDFDEVEKPQTEKERKLQRMELKAFEHYDYLVFVFDNQHDFINMASEFGITKVDAGYSTRKLGIGRVLKGEELIKRVGHQDSDTEPQP
jgi:hypothetical protein